MVNFKAQYAQFAQRQLTHHRGVFTDTTGENNGVKTAVHQRGVGTDVFRQAVAVNVHCAFSVGFFLIVVFHVAAVAGDFGQTQQAGLFGQHFVDRVNAHAQGVVQMEDDGRIDVTGAGTHHQAFQRGQTHGGVNAFTVTDSGNRTTVAEVAGDDVQLFHRLVEDLSGFLSHVEVAGAVRAVTTNAVLFVQAVRQGVEIGFFRHGLMERRIEYSHVFVFQVREGFQRFSDADQVCRVVQRCERRGVFNTLNYGLVDHHRAGVFFTAVYDTVADCGQLSRQFWFLCQNSVNDKVQRFTVRGARA
ncbi:Uncharacterised protein [Klebsiella pneumoniae]|nr:Uncharacterised protein [Klebsiella pneumoniae]